MNSNGSRREFLKGALALGATAGLSGCTAFDRILMGQSADNSDRVVILGAGMAGLAAAYELRKKGLPYRIFEGSRRVGGRAWSLESFTPAGQAADLGCEWFSSDQTLFWELAKELRLEIVEVKNQRDLLFLEVDSNLNPFPASELLRLRDLARKQEGLGVEKGGLKKGQAEWNSHLSEQKINSLAEWGKGLSGDSQWAELLQAWATLQYGVSISEIRSSVFRRSFLFQDPLTETWGGSRFKFRGGASTLAAALLDRVMGAIPGDRVQFGFQLTKIEKLSAGYELHFETPEGRKRFKALNVICTLPWACLSQIEGIEDFAEASVLKNPIVSHQAKLVMAFKDRFWKKKWDQGRILNSQPLWESSFRVHDLIENASGMLSTLFSGEEAQKPHLNSLQKQLQRLQKLEKLPNNSLPLLDSHLMSWSTSNWAQGRGAYPSLSQAENRFLRNEGSWVWAGEHAGGEDVGSWFGALQSAKNATAGFAEGKPLPGADRSSLFG